MAIFEVRRVRGEDRDRNKHGWRISQSCHTRPPSLLKRQPYSTNNTLCRLHSLTRHLFPLSSLLIAGAPGQAHSEAEWGQMSNSPPPRTTDRLNSVLHSLEKRSHSRAQSLSILPSPAGAGPADQAWRRQKAHSLTDPDLTAQFLLELENDLSLAAEVGQALLKEKAELEAKAASAEGANSQLLTRLSSAVKETAQLQRVSLGGRVYRLPLYADNCPPAAA